jgi:hypothetical protein
MLNSWFSQILASLGINKPRVFVETGSYTGNGINNVKDDFEHVYSIELSEKWYLYCKELFAGQPNVHLCLGDSAEVLSHLSSEIDEPALFYLDAHYSGGETAFGKVEDNGCPVLRELQVLGKRTHQDIVIIDDMRLMGKVSMGGIEGDTMYPLTEYDFTHATQQKMFEAYNRSCKIYFVNNIDRMILVPTALQ